MRANNLFHLNRDRGYRWRDRDQDLEWLCAIIEKSGLSSRDISTKTASVGEWARVSPQTIDRWLNGKTRRPQNFTLTWVAYVLGYSKEWRKIA